MRRIFIMWTHLNQAKVVSKAALIVLSPSLSAYRGNVSLNLLTVCFGLSLVSFCSLFPNVLIIQQYIENNPNSTGVPVTVRNDDQRWALLCAYVKEQLTLARNKVKGAVSPPKLLCRFFIHSQLCRSPNLWGLSMRAIQLGGALNQLTLSSCATIS